MHTYGRMAMRPYPHQKALRRCFAAVRARAIQVARLRALPGNHSAFASFTQWAGVAANSLDNIREGVARLRAYLSSAVADNEETR